MQLMYMCMYVSQNRDLAQLICLQQAPRLAANMTEILNYSLILMENYSKVFITTVPVGNSMVDIFVTFPAVSRAIFTIYTLSVAAINSFGSSSFTNPVSVGERQDKNNY